MAEEEIRIVKRISKCNNDMTEESLTVETNEMMFNAITETGKINIGWERCRAFSYVSVKRCFKCWNYFHVAKNCTRQEVCYNCAENHKGNECKAVKKKCINCNYKNLM